MKTKIFMVLIVLISGTFLTGCWNYQDIEDMGIAMCLAIDKNKITGDYILTMELVNLEEGGSSGQSSGEKGGKSKSVVIEAEGYTILDAMRNAIYRNGKKVFWGHLKGVIISEDVAREGIIPVLDLLWRDAETRPDICVVVSRNTSAGSIPRSSTESGEMVANYLESTVSESDSISKFIKDEMVHFISDLTIKTTSVVTPTVYTYSKEGKILPELKGSAVFKKDKLIYFLDEEESKTALLIRDELKGGIWTIDERGMKETIRVALEIFNSKTTLMPEMKNGKLQMKIKVKMEVSIAELGGSEDFIERNKRVFLEKDFEQLISAKINSLITKTQYNYATDIFGFDGAVKRKMPDYWKKNEDNWDYIYKNLKIIPEVDIDMSLSASTMKPIEIKD